MLLDSNTVIYAIKPEFSKLRELIAKQNPAVSVISYLEVLGYQKLTIEDERDFREFFQSTLMIPISQWVLENAVKLRQQRKMSLGDAIVAATAMLNGSTLVTANVKDFQWIKDIKLLNPLTELLMTNELL